MCSHETLMDAVGELREQRDKYRTLYRQSLEWVRDGHSLFGIYSDEVLEQCHARLAELDAE